MNALVVEDDAQMHKSLCRALTRWGFNPLSASDGPSALERWQQQQPAVVLLDLSLPGMDGLDVLQRGRSLGLKTPVLLLTARGTVGDRILGLNFGADDYLPKPFELDELEARLRALLRRVQSSPPASLDRPHTLGALAWEPSASAFYCGKEPLALTPRETALLRALVERPNHAHTKEFLASVVFPPEEDVLPDAVEVVTHRLRKKLAPCGVAIVTLRGVGYLIKAQA
ncbi:response regulator [Variovorax sp. CYS-02]|uniref:Response regulator n=2 Tax=Variovorax terrae TaxID=2923278 RepID=A0A9X2AKU3_9BURK|nr:response regulator [Variovorax terrae]MCJ0761913.1 response regulator [Variovorax terrae]